QAYEITLPVPKGGITKNWLTQLATTFHDRHQKQYGFASRDAPVTIVNLRVIAQEPMPVPQLKDIPKQVGDPPIRTKREAYFEELEQTIDTPIYERSSLGIGAQIIGPAIIEQLDSTTVIHPKTKASVHRGGNIIMEEHP
ncbi:MAG: hydantoinase/oxoprolinase family protein, partial [Candidatus Hermodarchaeia archaeon]